MFFRNRPALTYFLLTFAISWSCALAVAASHLLRHEPLPFLFDGKPGLRDLFARVTRWRFSPRWYALLLFPPALVLVVLCALCVFVSPVYTPNRFFWGVLFCVPAGLLQEIGWTGFAFPRLTANRKPLPAA